MSFAQKDRLDRIQHTLLPIIEKNFHRKRMKNDEIRAFFEPQILIEQINMFRGQNFRDFSKKISLDKFILHAIDMILDSF